MSDPRTYESRGFGFVGYGTEQVSYPARSTAKSSLYRPIVCAEARSAIDCKIDPCCMSLQEQDDAIRYLDDSNLQGRAVRVEKVPQPPPPAINGDSHQPQAQIFTHSSLSKSLFTLLPRLHDLPAPKPSPMLLYHTTPRRTSSVSCVLRPLHIY